MFGLTLYHSFLYEQASSLHSSHLGFLFRVFGGVFLEGILRRFRLSNPKAMCKSIAALENYPHHNRSRFVTVGCPNL